MMDTSLANEGSSQATQYRQIEPFQGRIPFRRRLAYRIRKKVTALRHRLPFRRGPKPQRPETPDLTTGLLDAESPKTPPNPAFHLDGGNLGIEDDSSESLTTEFRGSTWELSTFGLGINFFNASGVATPPNPLFDLNAGVSAIDDEWSGTSTPEAVVLTTDEYPERPAAPTPRRMALHVPDHSLLGDSLANLSDDRYVSILLMYFFFVKPRYPFFGPKPGHECQNL